MSNKKATRDIGKFKPIGTRQDNILIPTEGTDAHGRTAFIVRDENPSRINEVNESLYYLGWAEYGSEEDEKVWKIRRIQQIGSVWEQKYPDGEQHYRYAWTERLTYNYE